MKARATEHLWDDFCNTLEYYPQHPAIMFVHCKHLKLKRSNSRTSFSDQSLKRTWNAKSWHLKWNFAKLPPIPSGLSPLTKPTFYHLPYNNIFILSVQAFWAKHHNQARVLGLVIIFTNILLTPSPPVIIAELYPLPGAEGDKEQSKAWQIQAPGQMRIEAGGWEQGGHWSSHVSTQVTTCWGQNVNDCLDSS